MFYFAYGANLSKKEMTGRCPNCKPKSAAVLHNYKLSFVGWARQWRGGVATVKASRGDRVPGAIYEITDADLSRLDKQEGYPGVYDRVRVRVNIEGGFVEAFTYMRKGQEEEAPPSAEYLALIRQGYRDWEIE